MQSRTNNTVHGKIKQEKEPLDNVRQCKTIYDNTRHDKNKQNKTNQKTTQCNMRHG